MHCRNCGAGLSPDSKFCYNCGEKVDANANPATVEARPKKWFILLFLAFIGLCVAVLYFQLTKENLDQVVAKQLETIKDKHFTAAYYEYTTKDFQNTTTLEAFREFIKSNAFFKDNASVHFVSSKVDDEIGKVEAILTARSGEKGNVLYNLVLEGESWKIQYIQVIESEDEDGKGNLTQEQKDLLKPVELQLEALQTKDIKQSYEGLVSKDFLKQTPLSRFESFVKQYPILTNFIQYAAQPPVITKNQADLTVILNPGEENIPLKYKMLKEDGNWKIWGMQIVLPNYGGSANKLMHPRELSPVLDKFLRALRDKKIDEAYESFTSSQFKKITDLKAFRKFLEHFPLLTSYTSYTIKEALIENDQNGRAIVDFAGGATVIEALFALEIEGDAWKIQGIQEIVKEGDKSSQPIEGEKEKLVLVTVIQKFLQEIREGHLEKAYNDYTADELFRKTISPEKFKEFVEATPALNTDYKASFPTFTFREKYAKVLGTLTVSEKENYSIEFHMVNENGTWKIFHIEVKPIQLKPENGKKEALTISQVLLGTHIDDNGQILQPGKVFAPQAEELFVNVFVENGQPGDNIELMIKYLVTNTNTPPVSSSLSEPGSQTEVFYFGSPSGGWPEGNYELQVLSSTGVNQEIPFQIKS